MRVCSSFAFLAIGAVAGKAAAADFTGTAGNDVIIGGPGNDSIFGFAGDDNLFGNSGSDFISAAMGKDTVQGGAGIDIIIGGGWKDVLSGGSGDDIISGSIGQDILNGQAGWDTLKGGLGNDKLSGGPAGALSAAAPFETLLPGQGSDVIFCGLDADHIIFTGPDLHNDFNLGAKFDTIKGFDKAFDTIAYTKLAGFYRPAEFSGINNTLILTPNVTGTARTILKVVGNNVQSLIDTNVITFSLF